MLNPLVSHHITNWKSHPSHCQGVCKVTRVDPLLSAYKRARTFRPRCLPTIHMLLSQLSGEGPLRRAGVQLEVPKLPPPFCIMCDTATRYIVNNEKSVRSREWPGCAYVPSPKWWTFSCWGVSFPHISNSHPPSKAQVIGHRLHEDLKTLQPSTVISPRLPAAVLEPRTYHETPRCKKTSPFLSPVCPLKGYSWRP